jgi:hypothetical protein
MKKYRSSITGRYVSKKYAFRWPSLTVAETDKKVYRKKKRKIVLRPNSKSNGSTVNRFKRLKK